MFEGIFKRKEKPVLTEAEQSMRKDERVAKVAMVAGVAALGADIATQPDIHDLHIPPMEQVQRANESQPERIEATTETGAAVTMDLKQNIISMRPPGEREPVKIDLSYPKTNIKLD